MKRYNMTAYIHNEQAVPTFTAASNGRFVEFEDVKAIIEKATYWEEQFRLEYKRVGELCKGRDRVRASLKQLLDDRL